MANNGPEIPAAVEAGNVQARRNAEAFSEATQRAVAGATAFAEAIKKHKCKKALRAMLTRVVVGLALCFLAVVLRRYDHISPEVAVTSFLTLTFWLGIWVGAWLQYMWGKEGLLR